MAASEFESKSVSMIYFDKHWYSEGSDCYNITWKDMKLLFSDKVSENLLINVCSLFKLHLKLMTTLNN